MSEQPAEEIRDLLETLDDADITRHGFTPYMRDYEIVAAQPDWMADTYSVFRWLFTHCVVAEITAVLPPATYRLSWDDELTETGDLDILDRYPLGAFVWGVNWAAAYPGPVYVADSPLAAEWSERLDRSMHEVTIETNVYALRLVFHNLRVFALGRPSGH